MSRVVHCPLCRAKLFSCCTEGGETHKVELVCRKCKRTIIIWVHTEGAIEKLNSTVCREERAGADGANHLRREHDPRP